MKLSRLHPGHFWSNESGMTSLLIFTLGYLFVVCGLSELSFGDLVADLMFSLIIVAGVLVTFRQRWVRFLVIGLAAVTLALTWHQEIYPVASLAILNTILKLIFLGFLFAVLIIQVFGAGAVTAHRIRGAIVVYLLLGGMWSMLYHLVALTIPHSFHLPEGLEPGNTAALGRVLTYFSYTTLTTTGFGDVTPIRPWPAPWPCSRPWRASSTWSSPWPGWWLRRLWLKRKRGKITPEINLTQILRLGLKGMA